jgi:hypothetical protein
MIGRTEIITNNATLSSLCRQSERENPVLVSSHALDLPGKCRGTLYARFVVLGTHRSTDPVPPTIWGESTHVFAVSYLRISLEATQGI